MTSLVSLIIPTCNSEKFLAECLASVNRQTFRDFEVIIVDSNSTDSTLNIASSMLKCRLFQQQGKCLAAAWNQGIKASHGTYISFLDSDDWWEADCLSHHMQQLLAKPSLDYSIGNVKYIAENPRCLPYGFKASLLSGTHHARMPGCFVGKRMLFTTLGLFDENLVVATDIQWFHDLKMSGASSIDLNIHVLNKRIHANNLSYSIAKTAIYNRELLTVIRRHLHSGS